MQGLLQSQDLMKVRLWAKKVDVKRARKFLEERQGIQVCSSCETEVNPEDEVCRTLR